MRIVVRLFDKMSLERLKWEMFQSRLADMMVQDVRYPLRPAKEPAKPTTEALVIKDLVVKDS